MSCRAGFCRIWQQKVRLQATKTRRVRYFTIAVCAGFRRCFSKLAVQNTAAAVAETEKLHVVPNKNTEIKYSTQEGRHKRGQDSAGEPLLCETLLLNTRAAQTGESVDSNVDTRHVVLVLPPACRQSEEVTWFCMSFATRLPPTHSLSLSCWSVWGAIPTKLYFGGCSRLCTQSPLMYTVYHPCSTRASFPMANTHATTAMVTPH